MPIYRRKDDAIQGEKIVFSCRKHVLHKKPIHRTSTHKAKSGTLDNAFCVIEKEFRLLPEKE